VNQSLKIIEPSSPEEWKMYFDLRFEILRKPWNEPYSSTKDDTEDISLHYLMLDGVEAVATGRMQFNSAAEGQIRSMAVKKEQQGKGLGGIMVKHIEAKAKGKNIKRIVLDARENAVKFYESYGYKVIADSYLLFGVIRHYKMSKDL
jgi:predicted GNAT family N-acyltransferase